MKNDSQNSLYFKKIQGKSTNFKAFLKAVPYLKTVNYSTVQLLAERFAVSPEMLALLINIVANGGVFCYEN